MWLNSFINKQEMWQSGFTRIKNYIAAFLTETGNVHIARLWFFTFYHFFVVEIEKFEPVHEISNNVVFWDV